MLGGFVDASAPVLFARVLVISGRAARVGLEERTRGRAVLSVLFSAMVQRERVGV